MLPETIKPENAISFTPTKITTTPTSIILQNSIKSIEIPLSKLSSTNIKKLSTSTGKRVYIENKINHYTIK